MNSNISVENSKSSKISNKDFQREIFQFPKIENSEKDPETEKLKQLLKENSQIIQEYELTDINLENLRNIRKYF